MRLLFIGKVLENMIKLEKISSEIFDVLSDINLYNL